VQVGADRFDAEAVTVSADEKERLWPALVEAWPDYAGYAAATERDIPVVRLRRL
jgi:deazaflavin-dependent oxidoreductase (nitroreductase family)